ncbi:MAG: hypothetical protein ACQER6_01950 [Pseudomonadota bacterium]
MAESNEAAKDRSTAQSAASGGVKKPENPGKQLMGATAPSTASTDGKAGSASGARAGGSRSTASTSSGSSTTKPGGKGVQRRRQQNLSGSGGTQKRSTSTTDKTAASKPAGRTGKPASSSPERKGPRFHHGLRVWPD